MIEIRLLKHEMHKNLKKKNQMKKYLIKNQHQLSYSSNLAYSKSITEVGNKHEQCWQQCSFKIMRLATTLTTIKLILFQAMLAHIYKLLDYGRIPCFFSTVLRFTPLGVENHICV